MSNFGNIITAMVTPFTESGLEIDYQAVEKIVKHLINNGSDALVISGTTGESPTLSHEEEVELFSFVKNQISKETKKIPLIFGAGSNSTSTAITMSQKAEKLGADGLLIVTPYYNKPNQQGLYSHYASIAKSTSLPIILYNVPSRTNISLNAETIFRLVNDFKNIIALKEASTNLDLVSKIRTKLNSDQFKIYSGDDSLTLPMLAVGADGVISVASHIVGKQMQEMVKYFLKGQVQEALKLHLELFNLFAALFTQPNPTCIKAVLGIMNLCSDQLREPLVKLDEQQKNKLKEILNFSYLKA